jgi:hypothetical protein
VIHRAREHARELRGAHPRLEGGHLTLRLGQDGLVVLGRAEIEQDDRVVEVPRELLDGLDLLLDGRPLSGDGLRLLLVVPEARRERLLLEPVNLRLQPR